MLPNRSSTRPLTAMEPRLADNQARVHSAIKDANIEELQNLLQFFCTRCPYQPNATTMRTTAGVIVSPCKTPEIYVNSTSAQRQTDGRRAGLKIRSSQEGVGSSPTFGAIDLCLIATPRTACHGNKLVTALRWHWSDPRAWLQERSGYTREDITGALGGKFDTLAKSVGEPTRISLGNCRGLRFGVVLHSQFEPDLYLEHAATRTATLSREIGARLCHCRPAASPGSGRQRLHHRPPVLRREAALLYRDRPGLIRHTG